ncbi:MAG: ParB/RepB/Spo0J family partition protein [Desulfovibrio sp.]|jgi:ParB family chromosome partitioning protein|nr:ParB/RepB/Spo0J family partition protein [Desulfovibrio sp.]
MATLQTGLGKGLDGLIRNTQSAADVPGLVILPADDISPNPRQPRRDFSAGSLEELAASIRSQGLLQPLLVRPLGTANPGKYEIVAGERRWRACKLAGLTEIPAVIRSLSEQDTLIAALVENLQREDLNPLEEAFGLQALRQEFSLSQEEIAQKVGKSRSAVANSLRLLTLPESMRALLADGILSAGHGKALLGIDDDAAQEELKTLILNRHLSVRETEGLAARWKESGSFTLAGTDGIEDVPRDVSPAPVESPGASGDAAAPETKKRGAGAQSAVLMDIQSRIASLFSVPVKVTGKEEKGRISFAYNSKEELEALVLRLSTRILGGRGDPALNGRDDLALGSGADIGLRGRDDPALKGRADLSLDGRTDPALGGSAAPALSGSGRVGVAGYDASALSGRNDPVLPSREEPLLPGNDAPALDGSAAPLLSGRSDRALERGTTPVSDGADMPPQQTDVAPTTGSGDNTTPGQDVSTAASATAEAEEVKAAAASDEAAKAVAPPSQGTADNAPFGQKRSDAAFRLGWGRPARGPAGETDDRA